MAYCTQKNCLKGIIALSFMLFFQFVKAQNFSEAEDFLLNNQKAFGKNLVVLVTKEGKITYKKELGEDMTIKSAINAGEMSQWFTAAMVMILVDEGKISLDDPIAKYIPKFAKYMKGYITFRHCLTHTTGLETGGLSSKKKFPNLDEEVDNYITRRDIVNNPGMEIGYEKMGYSIAARAIELATKKSFDRISSEKLFRTLGMRGTSFYRESGEISPFDGAVTSANDMMVFMQMLLNNGMFNGKRILSEKSINELLTIQFPKAAIKNKPAVKKSSSIGLISWIDGASNGKGIEISQGLNGTKGYINFAEKKAYLIMVKEDGEKIAALADALGKKL
jgi:CubicO group peptidase (beta-lactamase class C family)